MIRLHVLCDGHSEESFTKELLYPHFFPFGIACIPHKFNKEGGFVTYGRVRKEILMQCKQEPSAYVTTFMDFYRLPKGFPAFERNASDAVDGVRRAEKVLQQDIDAGIAPRHNFIANIVAHEFEALLFSHPSAFAMLPGPEEFAAQLAEIRGKFRTPEHINGGPETAPSKRISELYPRYKKELHGTLVALDIGLDVIRRECLKFSDWIARLETVGNVPPSTSTGNPPD